MKTGIRTKTTISLLAVSLLTFGVMLFYSIKTFDNLKRSAMTYGQNLRMSAYSDCRRVLISRSCKELYNDALDFAVLIGSLQKETQKTFSDIFDSAGNESAGTNICFLMDHSGRVVDGSRLFFQLFFKKNRAVAGQCTFTEENAGGDMYAIIRRMKNGETGVGNVFVKDVLYCVGYAPVKNQKSSVCIMRKFSAIVEPAIAMQQMLIKEERTTKSLFHDLFMQNLKYFFLLLLSMLVFITGYALIRGYRLTHPIECLIENAQRIGGGDLNFKSEIHTGDELETLSDTLNRMSGDLQTYIANLNLAAVQKQKLNAAFHAAAQIQNSMLRKDFPPFPDRRDMDLYAVMVPAYDIGGDFYDFMMLKDNKLFIAVGDVAGKGVAAALFMATAKTIMRTLALTGRPPEQIMRDANDYLENGNSSCMFLTALCGILDCNTGKITLCSGGHNKPLLRHASGLTEYAELPNGFPLGVLPSSEHSAFQSREIQLQKGDSLLFYTDGVTEAQNPKVELFGNVRLKALLSEMEKDLKPLDVVEKIMSEVAAFRGPAKVSDDITMLLLSYYGKQDTEQISSNLTIETNNPINSQKAKEA